MMFNHDPYWLAMKWICFAFFALYFVLSVSGCTQIRVESPDGTIIERSSFLSDTAFGEFQGAKDGIGGVSFRMNTYQSQQIEAAKAIAQGVAEGLATGAAKTVKP